MVSALLRDELANSTSRPELLPGCPYPTPLRLGVSVIVDVAARDEVSLTVDLHCQLSADDALHVEDA